MIDEARVQFLNDQPVARGRYVLYWMQASQRSAFNPALEYAIERANQLKLPVVVGFGLMDNYPEANARHYAFMLDGLRDVHEALARRNIRFVVLQGQPASVAVGLGSDAALVVCDRGYLRHQCRWRDSVADQAGRQVVQVEGDAVVPIDEASDKQEFAARTLRPKIRKLLSRFMVSMTPVKVFKSSASLRLPAGLDLSKPREALARLKLDHSVVPSTLLAGGEEQAIRRLDDFVANRLNGFIEGRREPSVRGTSMLAAYLHFGQISPVQVALAVAGSDAPAADRDAFLEELIVRRELAFNFVFHQEAYDNFSGLPGWAVKTLTQHEKDKRPYIYSRQQLETGQTHDPYWNAAQREMILSGYMHNMMRMYWGKKILEWKESPADAFADALYLNNKYFLCGRDPASFANIGWLFGLHDRPWARRKIFGMVRYMNASGLERKFDMTAYVKKVEDLARVSQESAD